MIGAVSPELLRHYPFFELLSTTQLRAVAGLGRVESFAAGQVILREGDPAEALFLLVDGGVELYYTVEAPYRTHSSRDLPFGMVHPGEVFGITAMIEPYILTSSARATQPSQAVRMEAVELMALCNQDEDLAYRLIRQVARSAVERLNATRLHLAAAWSERAGSVTGRR